MPAARVNAQDAAVADLCGRLFARPRLLVRTTGHRVTHPLRFAPHVHGDLLQFDLLLGVRGRAWCGDRWMDLGGVSAMVSYPSKQHGYDLVPGDAPSRVYHFQFGCSRRGRRCASASIRTCLAQARHLLSQDRLKVRVVAEELGFDSAASFCRWFRQRSGSSPTEYRQSPELM